MNLANHNDFSLIKLANIFAMLLNLCIFVTFKLYVLDVGLLGAMSNAKPSLMLVGNDVFKEYKGAFSENYVLQQIKSVGDYDVCYYNKDNSTMEVDFLVQTTARIIPVEVKTEENVKSKSLARFVKEEFADNHLKGLRCSMKPYIDQDWMENIPLYAIEAYFGRERTAGIESLNPLKS